MEIVSVLLRTGNCPSVHRVSPYEHDLTALPRQGVIIVAEPSNLGLQLEGEVPFEEPSEPATPHDSTDENPS